MTRYRLLAGFGCGIIALSLTGFLTSMPVSAQEPPVISGQVFNATTEEIGVAGLDVTLHVMGPDGHADRDVVADEQGRFRFEGPDISPESSYHVSARYQGALYGVNVTAGEDGGFPSAALPIYEAVSDPVELQFDGWWLILQGFDQETGTLRVLEMIDVRNAGDRTYVAPEAEMVSFPLLPGAANFEAMSDTYGRDFVRIGDGLALRTGIPPGEHHIMYSYVVPMGDVDEMVFRRTVPLVTREFQVFALPDFRVSSEALQVIGTTVLDGEEYRVLTAGDLTQEEVLSLAVSLYGSSRGPWRMALAVLAGASLATAAAAGLLVRMGGLGRLRHRRRAASEDEAFDGGGRA